MGNIGVGTLQDLQEIYFTLLHYLENLIQCAKQILSDHPITNTDCVQKPTSRGIKKLHQNGTCEGNTDSSQVLFCSKEPLAFAERRLLATTPDPCSAFSEETERSHHIFFYRGIAKLMVKKLDIDY